MHVKLFEIHATGHIFFSTLLEQFTERIKGKLLLIDRGPEVERHIVHQETLQLFLKPHDRLIRLQINVESAQNSLLFGVDIWNQLQSLHVNRDSDPIAKSHINVLLVQLLIS